MGSSQSKAQEQQALASKAVAAAKSLEDAADEAAKQERLKQEEEVQRRLLQQAYDDGRSDGAAFADFHSEQKRQFDIMLMCAAVIAVVVGQSLHHARLRKQAISDFERTAKEASESRAAQSNELTVERQRANEIMLDLEQHRRRVSEDAEAIRKFQASEEKLRADLAQYQALTQRQAAKVAATKRQVVSLRRLNIIRERRDFRSKRDAVAMSIVFAGGLGMLLGSWLRGSRGSSSSSSFVPDHVVYDISGSRQMQGDFGKLPHLVQVKEQDSKKVPTSTFASGFSSAAVGSQAGAAEDYAHPTWKDTAVVAPISPPAAAVVVAEGPQE